MKDELRILHLSSVIGTDELRLKLNLGGNGIKILNPLDCHLKHVTGVFPEIATPSPHFPLCS